MGSGFESSGRQKEKKGGEEGRKEESGESFFFLSFFSPEDPGRRRGNLPGEDPGKPGEEPWPGKILPQRWGSRGSKSWIFEVYKSWIFEVGYFDSIACGRRKDS